MGARMDESSTAKNKRGRLGKQKQRFTQRDLARADRAAPNRTIIVRPDGSIELVPLVSKAGGANGCATPNDEWDDVLK